MQVHVFICATILQLLVVHVTSIFGYCPSPSSYIINPNQIPDYYWKEYIGIIPEDAVEGGTDEVGNPTYIGQAYVERYGLLPGFITIGCKTLTTSAYEAVLIPDQNIKILCARDKRKFEWVPTKKENLQLLTGYRFVVGGNQGGEISYIGRVNFDNRIIIGKFFTSYPSVASGLSIPYQYKRVFFTAFEVLTYNVNKHAGPITPPYYANPKLIIT